MEGFGCGLNPGLKSYKVVNDILRSLESRKALSHSWTGRM
jgi:hypothetical protein